VVQKTFLKKVEAVAAQKSLTVRLPADLHADLDAARSHVRAHGFELDVTAAVVDAIRTLVRSANRVGK
jgi:hypothetical protein